MENDKKYKFTTFPDKGKRGKPKTYFKAEEDLTKDELELLYQQFAGAWDYQPLKNKNRFIRWLVEEGNKLYKGKA